MIYLVQLCKDSKRNGGCATFTEHLKRGMGDRAEVVRVMREDRSEKKPRTFGHSCDYWNLTMDDFLDRRKDNPGPIVICVNDGGSEVADYMMRCLPDTWFVYHDFRSLQDMTYDVEDCDRVFVIRASNLTQCTKAHFIPHPYERFMMNREWMPYSMRSYRSVAHTRIDFDKRTHVILAANKLLPTELQCIVKGRENRLYGKHKLQSQFPWWEVGKNEFPRGWGSPVEFCHHATMDVDMTLIKGDGCGSQYSFLEAMDAGTIPVISLDWGDTEFCCYQCDPEPEALAAVLRRDKDWDSHLCMAQENSEYLERMHNSVNVANEYCKVLGV